MDMATARDEKARLSWRQAMTTYGDFSMAPIYKEAWSWLPGKTSGRRVAAGSYYRTEVWTRL